MQKIVIFGSTGNTGLCSVEAAVKKGLSVRAFLRDPSKLPANLKDKVEVIQGDVLNYDDVLKAVQGVNGVVVTLGTRNDLSPTTVLSDGMRTILNAMKEAKVDVVSVCLSIFLNYQPDKVPPIFKAINDDHQRQFDLLKESDLKYVAVLPPHIADEPSSNYEIEQDWKPAPGRRKISKYDLGSFLVECLSVPKYYGKVYGIFVPE